MHKTGNVVVEGVAIGKIQFLNADYEEQIKRYMTGTEEEEKKRYQEAHTLAKDDLDSLLEDTDSLSENEAEIIEAHQLITNALLWSKAALRRAGVAEWDVGSAQWSLKTNLCLQ